MDITEILLIFVILVLTLFLIIVGIQVFFILKDLRLTISKFNKVLDDFAFISQKIRDPLSSLSSATFAIKALSSFLNLVKGVKSNERE